MEITEAEFLLFIQLGKYFGRLFKTVLLVNIVLLNVASISQASPFRFTGEYGIGQVKDEDWLQFYRQTYGATFNRQVNQGFNYTADIRYTNNWQEQGTRDQVLMPSLNMNLVNDFFQVGLSGSSTEQFNDETADTSDRYVEGTFASKWRKQYVPELRFRYGIRQQFDDETPRTSDTDTDNGNANVKWDIGIGEITYNYSWQDRTNDVNSTEDNNDNHFARFDTSRAFLADRLRVDFSQTYSDDKSEFVSKTGASGSELIRLNVNQTYAGDDSTPDDNFDAPLNPVPALSDGNTTTTALTINQITTPDMNIGLVVNLTFYPQIDKVYLYTDVDISTNAPAFTWDLYSYDLAQPVVDPPTEVRSWINEITDVPFNYNPSERRFEFDVSGITNKSNRYRFIESGRILCLRSIRK